MHSKFCARNGKDNKARMFCCEIYEIIIIKLGGLFTWQSEMVLLQKRS